MGMLHGDCNTRQCMATAHVAYKQSFGFDAPPFTYADFEESDVLVFVGANPCIAHPIMWQRVMRNRHQPEIIVDRSAQDRDGDGGDAASRAPARRATSRCSTASRICSIARGCGGPRFHRRAHDRLRGVRAVRGGSSRRSAVAAETGLTDGQLHRFAETHRRAANAFRSGGRWA